jgi:beta-lactamase regulating signal transducer with metallopeptidase domain
MIALAVPLTAWFVSTALQVAVLVGLILLVERPFRGMLPAAWRYALWCLVLVRLACPVVPASPMSALNLLPFAGGWDVPPVSPAEGVVSSGVAHAIHARPTGPGGGALVGERSSACTTAHAAGALSAWFVGLWLLGFTGLVARGMRKAAAFRSRVRRGREVTDPAAQQALDSCREVMGVGRNLRLIETDAVSAPALAGILRPTLLVPVGLLARLSVDERDWVFLHELAHLRRWDVPVDALLSLLQALHWPNPVVHLAAWRLRAVREAARDAQVLARRTGCGSGATAYGQTLLKLAAEITATPTLPGLATTVESCRRLEARLLAIRAFRPSRRRQHLFGGMALLAVAVLGLSRAVDAPTGGPAQPRPAALASPAAPGMPPDVAAAIEEQFAQHPLVIVSARFIDVQGTPAEVREALPTLGIQVPENDDHATRSPALLSPAESQRRLADLEARRADVLYSPKVTVLSGTPAILRMVTERYFPKSWMVVHHEGRPAVEPTFGRDATDVGSVLEVMPRLDVDRPGQASLDLAARVTEVGDPPWRQETLTHTDAAGRRREFPVHYANLNVRTASASVVLPAGPSVCLYGGTLTGQREIVDKVRVLGSVPLLGRLFRSTRHEETASALLVLVTLERVGTLTPTANPVR